MINKSRNKNSVIHLGDNDIKSLIIFSNFLQKYEKKLRLTENSGTNIIMSEAFNY